MKNRILFCVPNIARRPNNNNRLFTLGLLYLEHAAQHAGWDTAILDAYFDNLSIEETVDAIINFGKFDIIGFTLNNDMMFEVTKSIINKIRTIYDIKPVFIAGGYYASSAEKTVLSDDGYFDFVIRGEGENALQDLLLSFNEKNRFYDINNLSYKNKYGKITSNKKSKTIANLDILGDLDFNSVSNSIKDNEWSLVTSRGCSAKCSFCLIGPHWSKYGEWRGHSAEWVVKQLDYLINYKKADYIQIVDDQFIGNSQSIERAWKIVQGMEKKDLYVKFNLMCRSDAVVDNQNLFERLRNRGLEAVFMGIETSNSVVNSQFNKNSLQSNDILAVNILDNLGIVSQSGTIIFHPWMTIDSLKQDIDFFSELVASNSYFTILGINELDIFKRTGLGRKSKNVNFDWRYDWLEQHKPIYTVYYNWLHYQNKILFPMINNLEQSGSVVRGRAIAPLQLEALRKVVDAYELASDASLLMIDLVGLTVSHLSKYVALDKVLSSITAYDVSGEASMERCFERIEPNPNFTPSISI